MANWPLKRETEPLVLLHVMPLERLGIAAIFRAAGGVSHLADGRPARVLAHQALGLAAMIQPKDLVHATQILEGIDQLVAARVVGGDAGRKLTPVLNVLEHPGDQPRNGFGPLFRAKRTLPPAAQVIDRGHTALVEQIAHRREGLAVRWVAN